jgi:hypothetical protein
MPSVSSHWKTAVPRPRLDAVRHSARYSGTTTPMNPPLMPWHSRPKNNRSVAVRESNRRNAKHECDAAKDHQRFTANPVGERAGKESRKTLPSNTAATMTESCADVRLEVASR